VVLETELTAGQRRAGEAHELEVELRCRRLDHPAHPQPRRPDVVALLVDHVAEAVVDGVHRHQPRGGEGVGEDGWGRVAEPRAEVALERVDEGAAAEEAGGGQGGADRLRWGEVLPGENAREIEADVLQIIGERVAEGVEGGSGDRHRGFRRRGGQGGRQGRRAREL